MNIFQRITKSFDKTSGQNEQANEIARINHELKDVRMSIKLLEMAMNQAHSERLEALSQMLNAKKEIEHLLIKDAKRLFGEKIRIEKSLREHREDTQSTTVLV